MPAPSRLVPTRCSPTPISAASGAALSPPTTANQRRAVDRGQDLALASLAPDRLRGAAYHGPRTCSKSTRSPLEGPRHRSERKIQDPGDRRFARTAGHLQTAATVNPPGGNYRQSTTRREESGPADSARRSSTVSLPLGRVFSEKHCGKRRLRFRRDRLDRRRPRRRLAGSL